MPYPTTPKRSVLECSIDWVTATFDSQLRQQVIEIQAERWIDARTRMGYSARSWSWQQYVGRTTDGISYWRRHDGTIVRLSGRVAGMHGPTVLRLAHNVSRLDVQITILDPNPGFPWHDEVEIIAMRDARCRSGQTSVTNIHRNPEGRSVYIGSRSSDRYFRVYDKHAESQGAYPAGSWRWEVEYKGARALRVANYLTQHLCDPESVRFIIGQAFADYGVKMPADFLPRSWSDAGYKPQTTDEGRLRYLATSIRPMLEKLQESTDRPTLLQILGLTDNIEAGPLSRQEVDELTGEVGAQESPVEAPNGWSVIEPW